MRKQQISIILTAMRCRKGNWGCSEKPGADCVSHLILTHQGCLGATTLILCTAGRVSATPKVDHQARGAGGMCRSAPAWPHRLLPYCLQVPCRTFPSACSLGTWVLSCTATVLAPPSSPQRQLWPVYGASPGWSERGLGGGRSSGRACLQRELPCCLPDGVSGDVTSFVYYLYKENTAQEVVNISAILLLLLSLLFLFCLLSEINGELSISLLWCKLRK